MGDDGGAFAWGKETTEIDDGARGVFAPAGSGELAGFVFFGGSAQGKGEAWVESAQAVQQSAPVVAAPVFGLNFGANADGKDGMAVGGSEDFPCAGALGFGQMQVPACGIFEVSFAQTR